MPDETKQPDRVTATDLLRAAADFNAARQQPVFCVHGVLWDRSCGACQAVARAVFMSVDSDPEC